MTVYELNRDQLTELKQNYYTQLLDERGESPSWGELANIDDYVSDETIQDVYFYDNFVNDDFFCSAGQPEEKKTYLFSVVDLVGTDAEIANALREIATTIENDYASGITNSGASWAIEVY